MTFAIQRTGIILLAALVLGGLALAPPAVLVPLPQDPMDSPLASPMSPRTTVASSDAGVATGPAAPAPPYYLDPHWANLSATGTPAPPRAGGTMAYDVHDREVVWFGGTSTGLQNQTWTFAGGAWTNRTASLARAPPGFIAPGASMAYDAADALVLLFGGGIGAPNALTWEFSNNSWSNVTSSLTLSPPARSSASMGYDTPGHQILLFGGRNGATALADTWRFSGGAWSRLTASSPVGGRFGSGIAFDGADNVTLLVGGFTNSSTWVNDTWRFTSGSWSLISASATPSGIGGAGQLSPAPGGGVVAFGGAGCPTAYYGVCNTTFQFMGLRWSRLTTPAAPAPREPPLLAYDGRDGFVLAVGGFVSGNYLNDTWALGGALRVQLFASPGRVEVKDPTSIFVRAAGGYGTLTFNYTGGPPDCSPPASAGFSCVSETPGIYSILAKAWDGGGNLSTTRANLTVLTLFASTLSIAPSTTDTGLPVTMVVSTVGGGGPVNYTWSGLPSGCSSSYAARLACVPAAPGFYVVVATVTDSLGHVAPTPQVSLRVNAPLQAWISVNRTDGTTPCPVQFSSTVSGGTSPITYLWNFGDGTTSTAANPAHVYLSPGTFSANLTVRDARNQSFGVTVATGLLVVAPLVSGIHASYGSLIAPAPVTFNATASGGLAPYSYVWFLGDGSNDSRATFVHTYQSAGSFVIVLIVWDSSGRESHAVQDLDVTAPPGNSTSGNAGPPVANSLEWFAGGGTLGAAIAAGGAVLLERRRRRIDATPSRSPAALSEGGATASPAHRAEPPVDDQR